MSSKPVALLEMPLPSVTRYSARVTCVLTVFLFVIAGLVFVQPCLASQLLAQGATAADKVLGGSTVAQPKTPVGAMFANPAALALFSGTVAHLSVGVSFIDTEVDASAPAAYKDDNSFLVLSPGIGLSVAREGPWHYGLAGYGSVGTKFDFDADPAAGVENGFFSEVAIFTSAVGVAYRFNDRLSVGAAIMPLLGLLKMRFTQQDIPFKYDLIGPGIQGMVGLRWRPREGLAVGLGVRTPGRVWMDGSMPLAGGEQDVDLEIKMPTQVFLGITKHFGERVTLSAAFRWTDASTFGNSLIEFELMPEASLAFVPGANDEYLVSAGVEYALSDLLSLRLGGAYSNSIVGTEGVSPLLFDSDDYRVGVGFGLNFNHWSLDFMAGHAFEGSRDVAADEAVVFPGRYSIEGQIVMIGATWHR